VEGAQKEIVVWATDSCITRLRFYVLLRNEEEEEEVFSFRVAAHAHTCVTHNPPMCENAFVFSLSKKLFFYFSPHTFVVVHFSESLAQLQAAKKRPCTAQH
jgi:hypothetical protein